MTEDAFWRLDVADKVTDPKYNLLWREHLLVSSILKINNDFKHGKLILIRHHEDFLAEDASNSYKRLLKEGDNSFIEITIKDLITKWKSAATNDFEHLWLEKFKLRYIDLDMSGNQQG